MIDEVERDGLRLAVVPELEDEFGVTVVFSGRDGGCSHPPFDGLNVSYNVGDETRSVRKNREALSSAVGVSPAEWVACAQVHGARVRTAGVLDRGRGAFDHRSALPGTDAVVTTTPRLAVAVQAADCVPVVLVATAPRGVAVAHAGWKGVLAGVITRCVGLLAEQSGCAPREMYAFTGPHIRSCCMEVGSDLALTFARRFGNGPVRTEGGRQYLDLGDACSLQLAACGIGKERSFGVPTCTCCGEGYFSYRRAGGTCGRQLGMAFIL